MKIFYRYIRLPLVLLLSASIVGGCHTVKEVQEVVHTVKEKVESAPKSPPQKEPEPSHEGPMLDNKVTALRLQEALKKAGAEFDNVEVKGTSESVIMTGTVKTAADRARAEEIAKRLHRRMKLSNEIKVTR